MAGHGRRRVVAETPHVKTIAFDVPGWPGHRAGQHVDVRVTAGGTYELLREASRALPDLGELELAEALAGLRPGTPDNLPLIGDGALEGLVLATGHYRNGVLLAPLTADRVADVLVGAEVPA